ncbi:hypothetical protein HPB50_025910 [Hyalomma asiaticum]|uniref:Uncharacterized protein n=1 Tax=Hyalomma asiaticum TaxID=266040 RepID=A0ACB7RQV9_HYAAI|nr:hypothetical protein HPB50_025910 [Hyalomma asiaticum]
MCSEVVVGLLAIFLFVAYSARPANETLAAQVILGKNRRDGDWLPPVFADIARTDDPPPDLEAALGEATRMQAYGIRLRSNITNNVIRLLPYEEMAVRMTSAPTAEKPPATSEKPRGGNASASFAIMLQVDNYDAHAARYLAEVFDEQPELLEGTMVVSPSPMFLFDLGGKNVDIVKALVWRPCYMTYEDAACTKRRYEKIGWHLAATAADWLLELSWEWGLLTRLTMASAVLVDASIASAEFVRRWS